MALAGVGALAGAAGAIVGAFGLRPGRGAAELLSYSFQHLDGRQTQLRDWRQPVILCNFWATWCAPCREEVPLLVSAQHKFAANGVEVAGIGIDRVDKLREFSQQFGITYPILTATGDTSELLRALGDESAALPYSVLLDRPRRIAYRKLGAWSKSELDREILAAIG